MKLFVVTAALLLAVPALTEDSNVDPEVSEERSEPLHQVDSEGRPGTIVAVDEALAYETIQVDGHRPHHHHHHHRPHCHHCPKPDCHHRPDHHHRPSHCSECSPRPHHPHQPYYPEHHKHHKKPVKDLLTDCFLCKKLNTFADELYYIWDIVRHLKCRDGKVKCWEPVWKAIYTIEFQLDELDKLVDKSPLNKCFDCRQEAKIACCYKTYAEALIRLLVAISEKAEYLPGEVDKYLVTAINSLRSADYAFAYELARRMQCDEYIKEIMKKQGALDGSTQGSIREAFALIVTTPYITGDNFEGFGKTHHGKKQENKRDDSELTEADVIAFKEAYAETTEEAVRILTEIDIEDLCFDEEFDDSDVEQEDKKRGDSELTEEDLEGFKNVLGESLEAEAEFTASVLDHLTLEHFDAQKDTLEAALEDFKNVGSRNSDDIPVSPLVETSDDADDDGSDTRATVEVPIKHWLNRPSN